MVEETRASYTDHFEHSFDAKGRLTVPAEWRDAPFEPRLYVFPSSERCVKIYPASWLSRLQHEISRLKAADPLRRRVEDLASQAQSTTWDQQGRIMVKEKLRRGAGLKKDVVLEGRMDHIEIWDAAEWKARHAAPITLEATLEGVGL